MGKKKKPIESDLLAAMKSGPGGGLSDDILDNAFWREHDQRDDSWVAALDRLDRLGDKEPLKVLLRSANLPGKAGEYLADLIERGVEKPKGRPRTPAYNLSKVDALLMMACENVRGSVQRGMSVDDALDDYARASGLARTTLANAYHGQRLSLRKAKKRL
jgi:hypothetical protein